MRPAAPERAWLDTNQIPTSTVRVRGFLPGLIACVKVRQITNWVQEKHIYNARYKGPTQTLYQPSMLKGVSVHNGLDSSLQGEKEAFIWMGEKYQDQKANPSTTTSPARILHKV